MTTVNLCFVTGVISPPSLQVGFTCGCDRLYQPTLPHIWKSKVPYLIESVRRCLEGMANCPSPGVRFWQTRICARLAAVERFHAVEFIPADATVQQTLFVQKNRDEPPFDRFLAPYLPEEMKEAWGCCSPYPSQEELNAPTSETDPNFNEAYVNLVADFLKDPLSIGMVLTYWDRNGDLASRGWYKA